MERRSSWHPNPSLILCQEATAEYQQPQLCSLLPGDMGWQSIYGTAITESENKQQLTLLDGWVSVA